ncbi:MAG: hypothetical protein WBM98_12535 [Maribacter sp.]|uniref:hypothetical protein n=1 Tax=Maribacter sp. TaxID=1897614 RepID=UPI003C730CC3
MGSWLATLKPPKFLRYFFYISYRWYSGSASERYQAHLTSVLFLAFTHFFSIFFILLVFFPDLFSATSSKYPVVFSIVIFLGVTHYILFLYKEKWKGYVKEFKHLLPGQRRAGTYLLLLYLFFMIGLNVAYIYNYGNGNTKDSILVDDEKDRNMDVSGVAKCISIQKENSSNFVFYEFFVDGRRILGTTPFNVETDRPMINEYFKVNYAHSDVSKNILILEEPILDTVVIKQAGFK